MPFYLSVLSHTTFHVITTAPFVKYQSDACQMPATTHTDITETESRNQVLVVYVRVRFFTDEYGGCTPSFFSRVTPGCNASLEPIFHRPGVLPDGHQEELQACEKLVPVMHYNLELLWKRS